MKIICFIVVLIKITKQVNSLQCYKNTRGAEPENEICKAAENKWCKYEMIFYKPYIREELSRTMEPIEERDMGERKCMGKTDFLGQEIKEGCVKESCSQTYSSPKCKRESKTRIKLEWYACYCKSDNCNYNCTAGDDCIKHRYTPPDADYSYNFNLCDGECQPMGGDQTSNSPATVKSNGTTAEEKNEDSEATENPDASTAGEKTEDSHATEAATEDGKGGDSKATEKSEGGTGEPESGTGGTKRSGCQRITNSFENFFIFWILASLVIFIEIY